MSLAIQSAGPLGYQRAKLSSLKGTSKHCWEEEKSQSKITSLVCWAIAKESSIMQVLEYVTHSQLVDSWVIWFMSAAKIQLLISHKLPIQPFHPVPGYEGLWRTEGTEEGVIWPWNELGFSKRNQKERNNKQYGTGGRCQTSGSWNWAVIPGQEWEHLVQKSWLSQSSDYLSLRPWLLIMFFRRGRVWLKGNRSFCCIL